MKTRRSRAFTCCLIPLLIGVGLVALALVGLFLARIFLWMPNRSPDVLMRSPLHGDQVSLQQGALVQAIARDRQGILRIELWVDGELLTAANSQVSGGSTPFPLSELWHPTSLGKHTLTIRAFDQDLKAGQATVVVEVVDKPTALPPETYEVQEGDTLADIASRYGLPPEDLAQANAGLADPLSPGATISLPPPPEDGEGPPPAEAAPPDLLPGESPPEPLEAWRPSLEDLALRSIGRIPRGRLIELEALSLEVDKAYDGVYCYLSLDGSAFERVPAGGYLEDLGDQRWGIEDWMAGDRRRVVHIAEGTSSFALAANCLGLRGTPYGGELFDLGAITVRHSEGAWDGSPIEARGVGEDGWFRVGYRIHPPSYSEPPAVRPLTGEEEPEPPYMPQPILHKECGRIWAGPAVSIDDGRVLPPSWLVTCNLGIDYTGAAEGFLLLRDGAIVRDIPTGRGEVGITLRGWQPYGPLATAIQPDGSVSAIWPDTGDLPSPGETYEFQVIAYVGDPVRDPPAGWRSPPSNVVEIGSDIWAEGRNVRLTLFELDTGCLTADLFVGGGLDTTGAGGVRPVDGQGHPIRDGCDADIDEWGLTTGGVDVNGRRIFSVNHYIHSWRRYVLERSFHFYNPSIELYLGPTDSLTISMRLWEDDVWSAAEAICHGEVVYSPADLEAIEDGPGERLVLGQGFASHYGDCYLTYRITVLP